MTAKEICKKFETSEGSFYLLPYTIKKISSYGIDVPIEIASTAKNSLFKDFSQGIYLWIHKGIIRKVGLFGEGVKSNFNNRYSAYRTTSLMIERNNGTMPKGISNGSVKPIETLVKNLQVNEEIKIAVLPFKTRGSIAEIDGVKRPIIIDLAALEEQIINKIKSKDPNQLWLK